MEILALDPDDMDEEMAVLIAHFALEDIEEMRSTIKGKSRADARISDEELALQFQEESLRNYLNFMQDMTFAKTLEQAVDSDAGVLEMLRIVEEAAADDRRYADALHRGEPVPAKSVAQQSLENAELYRFE